MDDRSFDRLARLLGEARDRRTGLKALVGGLLGAGGLAALDADAADAKRKGRDRRNDGPDADRRKKKKKTCKPACDAGYECVKVGKKQQCVCPSDVICGEACCAAGQTCENGACADAPDPVACIAAGEPCKSVGRACCDGRVCASGQGGDRDVACYAPKTGRCERTADCVYGMSCQGGQCLPPPPAEGLGVACDAAAQQLCAASGAVCTAYTGAGAPGGTYCTLGLRKVCTGNPQCTCYKCWYVRDGVVQGREGRASTNTMACCHPQGQSCSVDQDCCLGLDCVNGTCGGTICTPDEASGCDTSPCCNSNALCRSNVCQLGIPTGEKCSTAAGSLPCLEAAAGATCTTRDGDSSGNTYCLKPAGAACSGNNAACKSGLCSGNVCAALTAERCGASANGAVCKASSTDTCRDSGGGVFKCLQCSTSNECSSQQTNKVCDLRADSPTKNVCVQCTANTDCTSLGTGSCKTYTCGTSGADLNTCVASSNKAANTRCNLTGTNDGYCQAGDNAGTCGANVACSIRRADSKYAAGTTGDVAAGNDLKALVEGAGTGTTIIGIGNGTYAPSGTITVSRTYSSQNAAHIQLVNCEAVTTSNRPVITGSDARRIISFTNTALTIRNVDLTNGRYDGTLGGAAIFTSCFGGDPVRDKLTLEGVNIKNSVLPNPSPWNGGGISDYDCTASLQNTSITGCEANRGGGMYFRTPVTNGLELKGGVSITGNTARTAGAGVYIDNLNDLIVSCTGSNNAITSAAGATPSSNSGVACMVGGSSMPNFTDCGCGSTNISQQPLIGGTCLAEDKPCGYPLVCSSDACQIR